MQSKCRRRVYEFYVEKDEITKLMSAISYIKTDSSKNALTKCWTNTTNRQTDTTSGQTSTTSDKLVEKHSPRGVFMKRCSKIMQQIYKRTPMRKCIFNE